MYTDMPHILPVSVVQLSATMLFMHEKFPTTTFPSRKNHKLEHLSNFQQPSEYPKLVNEIICQSIFYNVKRYTIENTHATSVCVCFCG